MDIQGYIIDHWLSKMVNSQPLLTVYDSQRRYHSLLPIAAQRGIHVADTTCNLMAVREKVADFWMNTLPRNPEARLIIYRPIPMPVDSRSLQTDPYAALAKVGKQFPVGPNDEYITLCRQFLPTRKEEIDELDRQGTTSFANINALQEGAAYPELETLTQGKSPVEITIGLLNVRSVSNLHWLHDWQRFAQAHLPRLDHTGHSLLEVQKKLWNYLLFSEFAHTQPTLPAELQSVPVAPAEQKEFISATCRHIRNRNDLRDDYIQYAEQTTSSLRLDSLFDGTSPAGHPITFAFQNQAEYQAYIHALQSGNYEAAAEVSHKNRQSIWYHANKQVAAFWNLVEQATLLFKTNQQASIPGDTLNQLINWYTTTGYKADTAFRRYQMLAQQMDFGSPHIKVLTEILNTTYREFTEKVQLEYQRLIAAEGWTHLNIDYNLGAFDKHIAQDLDQGKRVVLILADAFRYEMGVEFAEKIHVRYTAEHHPSAAYLPTVTRFGMAALLPRAAQKLTLEEEGGKLQPIIDGKVIEVPADRMTYLSQHVKGEVRETPISKFRMETIPPDTRLLVLRSQSIDTAGENSNLQGLMTMEAEMKTFARVLDPCSQLNFDTLYIMADHGYMIQPQYKEGDKITPPTGKILLKERRCVAGNINETPDTLTFAPDTLGIRSSLPHFVFARRYGVFERGQLFFHEGLSLQENIVPIIRVALRKENPKTDFTLRLTYKGADNGTVRIQRPLIEIDPLFTGLFQTDAVISLKIHNATGTQAGEPVESQFYNETTGLITIPQGEGKIKQPIELNEGIEGDILIVALNPENNTTLATLTLQTDIQF